MRGSLGIQCGTTELQWYLFSNSSLVSHFHLNAVIVRKEEVNEQIVSAP